MSRKEMVAYSIIVPLGMVVWLDISGAIPERLGPMLFAVLPTAALTASLVWLTCAFAGFSYGRKAALWSAVLGGTFFAPVLPEFFGESSPSTRSSALAVLLALAGCAMLVGSVLGLVSRSVEAFREWRLARDHR